MNTVPYFAYGSDLSPRQLRQRLLDIEIIADLDQRQAASLADYAIAFATIVDTHPQIGLASIHPAPGSHVEGIVYHLPAAALVHLDTCEGVPDQYQRTTLAVTTADGTQVDAQVYVPNPARVDRTRLPSRNHLYRLLAAEKFFSPAYLAQLKSTPALKVPVNEDGMPHPEQSSPQPPVGR